MIVLKRKEIRRNYVFQTKRKTSSTFAISNKCSNYFLRTDKHVPRDFPEYRRDSHLRVNRYGGKYTEEEG